MTTKHGGKRTAGDGKKIGNPYSPYISKRVVLHFVSESEYQEFIKNNTPRQRVIKLSTAVDSSNKKEKST